MLQDFVQRPALAEETLAQANHRNGQDRIIKACATGERGPIADRQACVAALRTLRIFLGDMRGADLRGRLRQRPANHHIEI